MKSGGQPRRSHSSFSSSSSASPSCSCSPLQALPCRKPCSRRVSPSPPAPPPPDRFGRDDDCISSWLSPQRFTRKGVPWMRKKARRSDSAVSTTPRRTLAVITFTAMRYLRQQKQAGRKKHVCEGEGAGYCSLDLYSFKVFECGHHTAVVSYSNSGSNAELSPDVSAQNRVSQATGINNASGRELAEHKNHGPTSIAEPYRYPYDGEKKKKYLPLPLTHMYLRTCPSGGGGGAVVGPPPPQAPAAPARPRLALRASDKPG